MNQVKRFIAYFDYLGFKQFIENNDFETQLKVIGRNFRDMERSMSNGKYIEGPNGLINDISNSKINCINFSDTVVFFSNDDSNESMEEILKVAYEFNWQAIDYFFPVRGCIVYGELGVIDFKKENEGGGTYNINSVFGKGLVKACTISNNLKWAGSIIDKSFIDEIMKKGYNTDEFLKPYAKRFVVPYKDEQSQNEEFVLNLVKGTLNDESLKNAKRDIIENFANYNKQVDDQTVQEKLKNTLEFLESFYSNEN